MPDLDLQIVVARSSAPGSSTSICSETTRKTRFQILTHNITPYAAGKFMMIDSSTRRNLELCGKLSVKNKKGISSVGSR